MKAYGSFVKRKLLYKSLKLLYKSLKILSVLFGKKVQDIEMDLAKSSSHRTMFLLVFEILVFL